MAQSAVAARGVADHVDRGHHRHRRRVLRSDLPARRRPVRPHVHAECSQLRQCRPDVAGGQRPCHAQPARRGRPVGADGSRRAARIRLHDRHRIRRDRHRCRGHPAALRSRSRGAHGNVPGLDLRQWFVPPGSPRCRSQCAQRPCPAPARRRPRRVVHRGRSPQYDPRRVGPLPPRQPSGAGLVGAELLRLRRRFGVVAPSRRLLHAPSRRCWPFRRPV